MSAEFVLRKEMDGTFFFVFQTENGQVLLTSGAYRDIDTARRQLRSAWHMVRKERNYELRTAQEGGFYFVVKNRSNEVLAHSQLYPDQESRRQAMILTRGCSHGARIENPFEGLIKEQLRDHLLKHSSHTLENPFSCPKCGNAMVLRIARKGAHQGENFWGCSKFPSCRGFLEYNVPPN